MPQQSEQFQNHVYVHLPFTDRYLKDEKEAQIVRNELKKYFTKPLLIKHISPEQYNDKQH